MTGLSIDDRSVWVQAVFVPELSESLSMAEVRERLIGRYAQLPPDQVSAAVAHAHARFEHSKVRDFVPLLVERRASRELAGSPATLGVSA